MRNLIYISLLFLGLAVTAQNTVSSEKGRFSIDFSKGCYPFTLNLKVLDPLAVTRGYFIIDSCNVTLDEIRTTIAGDGSQETTFTLENPGCYSIVELSSQPEGIDKLDFLSNIEVIEPIEPVVTIQRCAPDELLFISNDSFYDFVKVEFPSGDSLLILPNGSNSIVTNENNYTLKGQFQNADDVCSSYAKSIAPSIIQEPQIVFSDITEYCRDNFRIAIELAQIDTLAEYQIVLSQASESLIYTGSLSNGMVSFDLLNYDKTFFDYCLNINRINLCGGASTIGNPVCFEPTEIVFSPFDNLYSSYNKQAKTIEINIETIQNGFVELYRKTAGSEFQYRGQFTESIQDPIGSIGRRYFYQLNYVDSCGELINSVTTNPPLIEANETSDNQYVVTFTAPTPIHPEIFRTNYPIIYEVGENNQTSTNGFILSSNESGYEFSLALNAKDGEKQRLNVALVDQSGLAIQSSNTLTLKYDLIIHVPQAFTPNNDGLNDTLDFYGLPSDGKATIYSRWGQTLWQSDLPFSENQGNLGWDGKVNDALAPEGTYLYEVTFSDAQGNLKRQRGSFVLIK